MISSKRLGALAAVVLTLTLTGCEAMRALMPVRTETVIVGPDRAALSLTIREVVCQSFEPDGMDQGNRDAFSAFECDALASDLVAAGQQD